MPVLLEDLSFYLQDVWSWSSLLDIALVTLILYSLMLLIKGTRAIQVLRGFLIVAALMWFLLNVVPVELPAFNWMLDRILPAMFIAIPVIFQPELRRALERVGGAGSYFRLWQKPGPSPLITAVVQACRRLSQRREGALIIFEQETGLQEYVDTGVKIDALPTSELLLTIFNKHTELHDGAVIIRGGRVVAAACVMPLSSRNLSDRQLGLRHRASLGISEVSDVVALVVSEETGHIAIAHNGRLLRRQDPEQLETILQAFLQPNTRRQLLKAGA
jgi:diadenylate cyclase